MHYYSLSLLALIKVQLQALWQRIHLIELNSGMATPTYSVVLDGDVYRHRLRLSQANVPHARSLGGQSRRMIADTR